MPLSEGNKPYNAHDNGAAKNVSISCPSKQSLNEYG